MPNVVARSPFFPESEKEVTLRKWLKTIGDPVRKNEPIAELETAKVIYELPSPCFGIMKEHGVEIGAVIGNDQALALIEEDVVMELEHSKIAHALEERIRKYCCPSMFEAVTGVSTGLKFQYTWFRGEWYWEMSVNDDVVGHPKHCPWCGKRLLDASFE